MADMLGNVHCSGPLQCLLHHLTDICLGALDQECLQGNELVSELAWCGLTTSSSPLVVGVILLNHPQVSSTHGQHHLSCSCHSESCRELQQWVSFAVGNPLRFFLKQNPSLLQQCSYRFHPCVPHTLWGGRTSCPSMISNNLKVCSSKHPGPAPVFSHQQPDTMLRAGGHFWRTWWLEQCTFTPDTLTSFATSSSNVLNIRTTQCRTRCHQPSCSSSPGCWLHCQSQSCQPCRQTALVAQTAFKATSCKYSEVWL